MERNQGKASRKPAVSCEYKVHDRLGFPEASQGKLTSSDNFGNRADQQMSSDINYKKYIFLSCLI